MPVVKIKGVGVYYDADTVYWHFGQIHDYCGFSFHTANNFLLPKSLNDFISDDSNIKFACYHVPFPYDEDWITRFHNTYSIVKHSFVICSELHVNTVKQLESLDLDNVSIFVCGVVHHKFTKAKLYSWMDWFETSTYFYKKINPRLLEQKLLPHNNKNKYFDVLLGCQRPHRDYVYEYINTHNLNDKVIMTYFKRWNIDLRNTDHIFENEGLEFLSDLNYHHTVHRIKYYGHQMNLSQVVPTIVYNDTCYSLVTETNSVNNFNFYTEKIVKPIISGRLFIVIAGQHYLQNLRNMGFKTFNKIIDESYDDESDNEKRWAMAMEQVKLLCDKDPLEIYSKIKGVVDYNKHLMLNTDWLDQYLRQVMTIIDSYLTTVHKVVD